MFNEPPQSICKQVEPNFQSPTIVQRFEQQVKETEIKLTQMKELLETFQNNPELHRAVIALLRNLGIG
jgi:ferritin-like metal-binding protein YciE